ncbi:DnaA regulatory inactivator Hda [bacterium BMS3Bbin12]|nr:DnaA regulatory inactivator Hda [bacterium BMS3Abin12]GBE48297.1 DnaA regulatory inactivator Hda [bacterium BMS3Bbin12]GBE50806.1 DnaA regulatory inactivator Hda [bacterium BMS3Bbin13]
MSPTAGIAMATQLPLDIGLRGHASFDGFVPGPNVAAVQALGALAAGDPDGGVYLWGACGVGKSHLLQAACRAAHESGRRSGYLPLGERGRFSPQILQGLEQLDLVCIDDLDAVAGERTWELALLDLYHRLQENGGRWAFAASARPDACGWLPDLGSRLAAGLVFGLRELDDADKLHVLRHRAEARGLVLAPEAARYLLTHCRRDLGALCAVLDRLDGAALAAQRRLTIPFIRSVLGG